MHSFWRAVLFVCTPALLQAQVPDSGQGVARVPATDSALRLPVDRASDLLSWLPGGGLTPDGTAAWHGYDAALLDRWTDGIRWASAVRSRGPLDRGAAPVVLEPALNAIATAGVGQNGRGPAALFFTTPTGGERWMAYGSAESEGPVRADGGADFSRIEASVGGPLGRGFRFLAAGSALGRRYGALGVGAGSDAYFVPVGIDTTVTYALGVDTVTADVQTFGARDHMPNAPRTDADWLVRVDGRLAGGTVWARWLGTRTAERYFSYPNVSDPAQTFGRNALGTDLAVGGSWQAGPRTRLEAALSHQRERSEQGPLDVGHEPDSRDPGFGMMLGGVDLRWTLDNFPVDGELLQNYRANTPGSRRSPYDLENTAQYALVDQYRNNAYGLLGFSERGGPVGTLDLHTDRRFVGEASVTHSLTDRSYLRGGLEWVRHDIQYYSHQLTSQAYSDVWLERPVETALHGAWVTSGRQGRVEIGARLDRFHVGGRRPYVLYTVTNSPSFGRYTYLPRISSYGNGVDSLHRYVEDEAHLALAPYATATLAVNDGLWFGLEARRSVRMPDLTAALAGVNTDLAITNTTQGYGQDMGHEVVDHLALSVTLDLGPATIFASGFNDRYRKLAAIRSRDAFQPASNTFTTISVIDLASGGDIRGASIAAEWRATAWLRAQGAYTYAHVSAAQGEQVVPDSVRTHTLGFVATAAPDAGSLRGFGLTVGYRHLSGAARPVDPGAGPLPFFPISARTEEMPAWSSLDLRLTRAFAVGSRQITAYVDARNLLNAEHLLRAFWSGAATSAPLGHANRFSSDSNDYAREAANSGHYDNATGAIDLTFGGMTDPRAGCGAWVTAAGTADPPNCIYLIAAEERFGDGDHTFTLAEQRRASDAYYFTQVGRTAFSDQGRRLRVGVEVRF